MGSSGHSSWWLGAFLSSSAVVALTTLVLRRVEVRWTLLLATGLSLAGLVLALAPVA